MPVKTGGGLETVSVVLTQRQARRLRELVGEQSTEDNRVSLSEVARRVVGAGLRAIDAASATDSDATVPATNGAEVR